MTSIATAAATPTAPSQIDTLSLEGLNPADPQWFVDDTIGNLLRRLRLEDPVHRSHSPVPGIGDYWSVTRYRDIMQVEMHPAIYSSDWSVGGISLMDFPPGEQQLQMFIAMDPPRHDEQRKAVSPIAAQGNLDGWEGLIRERTCKVLDSLPRGETFDWVDRVSIELTSMMLATLFDFPQEERRRLTHWSDLATSNKLTNPDAPEPEVRMAGLREMLGCFMKLWNERVNAPPRADLVSMLAHSPATRNMTPLEFMGNLVLLIVGGNDTTRNTMTGGLLALLQHPGQMKKLRADPSLIGSMVTEVIRWQTPLAYMRRTATQDTELGGKQIRKGDKLALWYLSANRDEAMIPQPDEFIIDRPMPRLHLSFGFGIHRCVGNRIADLQLRILWEELLRRGTEIELMGEPKRVRSSFVHGFSQMPVRIVS
ncbi:cytochrome P450 [Variovorax robiniae]|uniref:Cytochrome P450 n=1 Tax=Variovorax robiniae TaxID=1836199 RepID=A0ABU8X2U9_9BURK